LIAQHHRTAQGKGKRAVLFMAVEIGTSEPRADGYPTLKKWPRTARINGTVSRRAGSKSVPLAIQSGMPSRMLFIVKQDRNGLLNVTPAGRAQAPAKLVECAFDRFGPISTSRLHTGHGTKK
jgi:hypothetical protein